MFMASALIIGSTGGIGAAVKNVLVKRGDEVVGLSRSVDGLDVTNEASIKQLFEAHQGQFDLVLIATGALTVDGHVPEKSIKALDPSAMVGQFLVNAVGPALVLKHAIRLLPRDRPSAIVALSARVGSIGDNKIGGWHSYRMAKAALNQLIHGAAIELARTHKRASCVCIHPGTVETLFTKNYAKTNKTVTAEEAAVDLVRVFDQLTPEHSGGFFDSSGKEIAW